MNQKISAIYTIIDAYDGTANEKKLAKRVADGYFSGKDENQELIDLSKLIKEGNYTDAEFEGAATLIRKIIADMEKFKNRI